MGQLTTHILDTAGTLLGVISDGDLRRYFLSSPKPGQGTAAELMTAGGRTIEADLLAIEALEVFQNLPAKIGEMPVLQDGKVVGLLVLKDLLRSGIV